MDNDRFDRLSKRVAAWPLTRRRAVRALGAAGVAAALLGLQREHAAADCPDITVCGFACGEPVLGIQNLCMYDIPGGPYGMCWSWDTLKCDPCSTTRAELNALCNRRFRECAGGCVAA
jgi:hypothetical protein